METRFLEYRQHSSCEQLRKDIKERQSARDAEIMELYGHLFSIKVVFVYLSEIKKFILKFSDTSTYETLTTQASILRSNLGF